MGLAGDEQDAQLVAHTLDVDDRAIAVGRKLVGDRGDFELDHVRAGMPDRHFDVDALADLSFDVGDRLAVPAHGQFHRLAAVGAVEHARGDDLILADDAVARRLDQHDAALPLARMAGDQRMQRGVEPERGGRGGNVVDDAVGDQDRAADPLRRRVGERAAQRGEQLGAVGVQFLPRGFAHPHVDVAERLQARHHRVSRLIRLMRPLADVLTARTVDHDGDDVLERTAVFPHQVRVAQSEEKQRERQRPQPCAPRPAPEQNDRNGERRRRERVEGGQRNERRKDDRPDAQRVSLSRISLACTWSAL